MDCKAHTLKAAGKIKEMITGYIIVWIFVFVLGFLVYNSKGVDGLKRSGKFAGNQAINISRKMPFALLTAAFIAQSAPVEDLAYIVGPNSGLVGIIISAVLGGLLPGGPMTSFPIALIFFAGGAGAPQIVAFISGWSIFAVHRVLVFEAPTMGWSFVTIRLISCAFLPILAGIFVDWLEYNVIEVPQF